MSAYGYDAWGKIRNLNGQPDAAESIAWPVHGYTNQRDVGPVYLIDLNARMYDPYIGVLTTVDPAVANWLDSQTWNAYAYARDNPMRYTDPTGDVYVPGAAYSDGEGFADAIDFTLNILGDAVDVAAGLPQDSELGAISDDLHGLANSGQASDEASQAVSTTSSFATVPPPGSVAQYEVGAYGSLKARPNPLGLQMHHIPSNASLRAAEQARLGRRLTPAESRAVQKRGIAIAVSPDVHASAPTTGGRNTAAQIAGDLANPSGAVARDTDHITATAPAGQQGAAANGVSEILNQPPPPPPPPGVSGDNVEAH